tara:strand:- start:545 stop:940 length:396 start_codon:yes stop_codon:yes gene_type:complete
MSIETTSEVVPCPGGKICDGGEKIAVLCDLCTAYKVFIRERHRIYKNRSAERKRKGISKERYRRTGKFLPKKFTENYCALYLLKKKTNTKYVKISRKRKEELDQLEFERLLKERKEVIKFSKELNQFCGFK